MVRQSCQSSASAKTKKVVACRVTGGKNTHRPGTTSIKLRALDMKKPRQAC
jgi:hypothetical protein